MQDSRLLALVALTSILATSLPVSAETGIMPVAAPPLERVFDGYDWESRVRSTHLIVSAIPLVSTIALDDAPTSFIDLEIKDLMPDPRRGYALLGPTPLSADSVNVGAAATPIHTLHGAPNHTGAAVFWSVPAETGTWILQDKRSGEPISVFVMEPRTVALPEQESPTVKSGCPWWYRWCKPKAEEPKPVSVEYSDGGLVIEQAAYSFTPKAEARVTAGWEHQISVTGKISGGVAAQVSAGTEYQYGTKNSYTFKSVGAPVIFQREVSFRKDNYEDGSYRIYATGPSATSSFKQDAGFFSPPPEAETIVVGDVPGGVLISRTEFAGGGVFFSAGVNAFGMGIDTSFHATGGVQTQVEIALSPNAKYRVHFVDARDGGRGFAPMVWEVT